MRLFHWVLIPLSILPSMVCSHHIGGGEISYHMSGSNTMTVTVKIYQICNAAISGPLALEVFDSCGYNIGAQPLFRSGISGGTPISCTGSSGCTGNEFTLEAVTYFASFNLPGPCSNWTFIVRDNYRTDLATTADNDAYGFRLEAMLNNSVHSQNSSPDFQAVPSLRYCTNLYDCINHSATDQDGDSIVYRLISPLLMYNDTFPYNPPYSPLTPFPTLSGITMDPQSGQMCFTPSGQEISVYAIRVDDFRNGIHVGSSMRDMMIILRDCVNHPPTLISFGDAIYDTVTVCVNEQSCFDFTATDPDVAQSVNVGTLFNFYPGEPDSARDTTRICFPTIWQGPEYRRIVVYAFDNSFQCNNMDSISFILHVTNESYCYGVGDDLPGFNFVQHTEGFMEVYYTSYNAPSELLIWNLAGQEVYRSLLLTLPETISTLNFADGIYIARISQDGKLSQAKKIVIN